MQDKEPFIVTFTGQKVHVFNPSVDEINIEDIAHALSNKCRFNGHTKVFYSVAQHSVIVSNLCGCPPLWGLLHDAAEAYLPDVATPLKQRFPTLVYAEEICFEVIKKKFNLPPLNEVQKKALKKVDKAVLRIEWNSLINSPQNNIAVDMTGVPDLHWSPSGFWGPLEAERAFLTAYSDLRHDYR